MANDYDIGIAGGGMAGLCLSLLAADAGYSVVLFEKEKYPFHKVCGEYISYESYDFLILLGLPLADMNLPEIKNLQVSDVNGRLYDFKLDPGGFGISRYTIDNMLYQLALKAGVTVFTEEKVTDISFNQNNHIIQSNKREVTAKIVAGTYGKRSNLDVKWKRSFVERKPDKLNNYIGVKYHVRTGFEKDHIALHNFKNGYCGISAIEDDKYCLCYLTTAKNLSASANSIQKMQEQVLYKNPGLKKLFTEAEFLYDAPLTISQISFDKKKQIENHILMLGDAAGMITPLCGNGMSMAIHASKLAFAEMNDFLKGRISRFEMETNYTSAWKKQFALRLATGRMVQRCMGNNSTSVVLKLLHGLPFLGRNLIRATHGKPF
ncbi:NAD(P)/FAD-dependent oxidoreductase [Parafilimonas terrae]|jgi:flavin-dependent dehydrogenase|uniref:Dehydrogenase (Flavoprotein) n=1 Tax=Parafilimonas terrae TaxID=1465490 RepID=A0A1I5XDF5_9BACT|nr:FAD-dependent monooxygenase [Parafilimonas terrae]SFQ29990.1 Dehydrogenase (flavoprotein) [Parafilimonas terrae]